MSPFVMDVFSSQVLALRCPPLYLPSATYNLQSAPPSYAVRVQARLEVLNKLATRHIDDGNLIRARKREIAAVPVGREHDALRPLANAHVRDDFSAVRVDHGERIGRDV